MSRKGSPLAGFQVIMSGRFWVFTEDPGSGRLACVLLSTAFGGAAAWREALLRSGGMGARKNRTLTHHPSRGCCRVPAVPASTSTG